MNDSTQVSNVFIDLDAFDIVIGDNGLVVLIGLMFFSLIGNLFKKYQRFKRLKDRKPFQIGYWLKDNSFEMIVGFLLSYLSARLFNLIIPMISQFIPAAADVSEILILAGLIIGYKIDDVEKMIVKSLGEK